MEFFERDFIHGDYFDLESLNKNGQTLLYLETECDSDVIYLNNKKYNECFQSSITRTEKLRKKFILNSIENMKELPKLRFDLFYEHVNVEVLLKLILKAFIQIIFFAFFLNHINQITQN